MHICHALSFFFTSNTREDKGLQMGWINLDWSNSVTCFSISDFWKYGYLYGWTLMGLAEGIRLMWWTFWHRAGKVVGYWKMVWNLSRRSSMEKIGWIGYMGGSGWDMVNSERWNKAKVEWVWIIHLIYWAEVGAGSVWTSTQMRIGWPKWVKFMVKDV